MLFKVRVLVTVGGQHLEGDRGPSLLGGVLTMFFFLIFVVVTWMYSPYENSLDSMFFISALSCYVWCTSTERGSVGGLLWWLSGKEPTCQCRRHGLNPWSEKIPYATEQLSLCTTAIEPVLSYWAHELQLLNPRAATAEVWVPHSSCSATGEATAMKSLCTAARE